MRTRRHSDISRRSTLAVLAGALLLHALALWCLTQRMRVGGEVDVAQSPAMFAFFVRPLPTEPLPTRPSPTLPNAVTQTVQAAALRVPSTTARPNAAAAMPFAAEPPEGSVANGPAAIATPATEAARPAAVPALAAPRIAAPEDVTVARPDHGQCPPPVYPVLLRDQGIAGVVTLRVHVDALGRAAEVQLLQTSGWRLFDEAALQQARGCRFVPERRSGEAHASWVEFPVRFVLAG